ncbi:uncharacterized protein DI49_1321 [Saccharomyces eubayanus]|uniref:uncharacterized protein n=1 Tax=Saccharomyces eubayanus TaxID=1080349 RepID=UPI0006C19B11|nr:hypothetical protein DI49_1321 [Saccharomyces eubayanus]KOH00608.1 hypothetical protein DI49_1321 [Saccharomyces eubayanus]
MPSLLSLNEIIRPLSGSFPKAKESSYYEAASFSKKNAQESHSFKGTLARCLVKKLHRAALKVGTLLLTKSGLTYPARGALRRLRTPRLHFGSIILFRMPSHDFHMIMLKRAAREKAFCPICKVRQVCELAAKKRYKMRKGKISEVNDRSMRRLSVL